MSRNVSSWMRSADCNTSSDAAWWSLTSLLTSREALPIYLVVALSWERSIRDMVLTKAKTFLDCEVVGIDSRLFSSRSVPLREETVLELDTTAAWVGRVVPRASVETSISLSLFRILWVVLASHSVLRLPQL